MHRASGSDPRRISAKGHRGRAPRSPGLSYKNEGIPGNAARAGCPRVHLMKKRIFGCFVAVLLFVAPTRAASSDVADAVMRGKKDVLRSLLQRKADVNVPQVDGTT